MYDILYTPLVVWVRTIFDCSSSLMYMYMYIHVHLYVHCVCTSTVYTEIQNVAYSSGYKSFLSRDHDSQVWLAPCWSSPLSLSLPSLSPSSSSIASSAFPPATWTSTSSTACRNRKGCRSETIRQADSVTVLQYSAMYHIRFM